MKNTISSLTLKGKNKFDDLTFKANRTFKTLFSMGLAYVGKSKLFAQSSSSISQLDTSSQTILDIVTGKPMKVVLILAVIVCFGCIAWGNAQGEGGMFKKVIPVLVGIIGISCAVPIVIGLLSNGTYKL